MIHNANEYPQDQLTTCLELLEQELFHNHAWSKTLIQEELNAPNRTYIVDTDTRTPPTIRGYAGYWYDGYDAQIMTIGVHPAHQHKGIGSALLDNLIQQAQQQGAERILLEVRTDNPIAIHLYESRGFTRMGIRKHYYQPEGTDAYTMSLTLREHIMGFTTNTTKDQA